MCDTNDKCGLLSSQDLYIDFFPPPPYTTVVVPAAPQSSSSRLQQDSSSSHDSESAETIITRHDRKLKIRLLLLVAVALLSLLAIVAISLQLIVRHMEVGSTQQQHVEQLMVPAVAATAIGHEETVIEIQLLGGEAEADELSGE
jgi:hypothetical protein